MQDLLSDEHAQFVAVIAAAAGCLAAATAAALGLEALFDLYIARLACVTGVNILIEDGAAYSLENGAEDFPGEAVAVICGKQPQQPTILVSDEDVDGARVRRLRFFDAPSSTRNSLHSPWALGDPDGADQEQDERLYSTCIQSEILLASDGTLDHTCLRSRWHCLMLASLGLSRARTPLRHVCVLGNGAGALSSFLRHVLKCKVTALEKDPAVVALARDYFGDTSDVHIGDAARFILGLDSCAKFDAILIDLNAPSHEPLAAPPECVYQPEVVRALVKLSPVVILNLLPASRSTACDMEERVQKAFSPYASVHTYVFLCLCFLH